MLPRAALPAGVRVPSPAWQPIAGLFLIKILLLQLGEAAAAPLLQPSRTWAPEQPYNGNPLGESRGVRGERSTGEIGASSE